MINYKIFNSNNTNNCQSCEQLSKKNNSNSNSNKISNNMKEIINLTKTTTNVGIVNYNSLSQNKLFNNKITIEYYGNNNSKGCPNC